ncbi:MAG: 6,7-dimethyl-8-ribityllumazine synthase [Alphaproteobacteria bacterium]|nr:6,7-dimethyl-8-ribityllumazine synthase [Alphaproteobacteria bacterium]
MAKGPHLLLVEARFYDDISDGLLEGAKLALDAANATYDRMIVPGALEIPYAIRMAAEASDEGSIQKPYDGYVALGCVIRGETTHYEIVSEQSARGIMDLTLEGLAIGNGILTVENEEQAWERASAEKLDKGGGAAAAALAMITIRRKLGLGE